MNDMTTRTRVSGDLFSSASIDMEVTSTTDLSVTIHHSEEADYYMGSYTVSPDFVGTTLDTSGKYMEDNVTVEPIEVESVSNTSGGRTVYIGGII